MARRSRRGRKERGNSKPLLIGLGAVAAAGIGMMIFKPDAANNDTTPRPFNISQYRQDGSRFASSGNRYVFEGRVESIESHGDNRIVSISMKGAKRERLPLLVPGKANLRVNLTRGDSFVFNVSCCTGRSADGKEVKGILVVNNVETK